jgi:pectinesterase
VLSETGAQLFSGCYIEGATDFIFGQQATAWFEKCTIGVLPTSIGYISASGRTSNSSSYYVFNGVTIGAAPGKSVTSGVYYLGRPWGDYARVAFQSSSMSNVINSAGWHIWNTGDERTDHVSFGEYANSGAGASGSRATFATKLSSALAIGNILGSSYASQYYVDTSYL